MDMMDVDDEITLYKSYRCSQSCPSGKLYQRTNIDFQCTHVCYDGCESMCTADYDPVFQFEEVIKNTK